LKPFEAKEQLIFIPEKDRNGAKDGDIVQVAAFPMLPDNLGINAASKRWKICWQSTQHRG
jgi:exoribonuclease R